MIFFFLITMVTVVIAGIINNVDKEWERNLFNGGNDFTRNDLMEAYIHLGSRMIQVDREESGAKIRFIHKYLSQHFFNYNYPDFIEILRDASKNPLKVSTLVIWLKSHMPQKAKRMQVLYFLAGLSMVDGTMNHRELKLLREMSDLLDLSVKDFESVLSMYKQREERYQQREQEQRNYVSKSRRVRQLELACKVIGISENASMDEIKKAYRKLVKLHHPDRFATESKEQQELAEERFLEVQKAYEVIEKIKF